jgi:predicted helicase
MSLSLKPNHASVKAYYETLHEHGQLHFDHEGAVRRAFADLLAKCGRKSKPQLTLITEYLIERARSSIRVDGALVDLYHLPHGYWEAKDEKDDLSREVQRKLDKGYPRDNIIFQAPERAILYQGGARIIDESIKEPETLVSVVNSFFDYKAPHIQEWEQAVGEFSERIPELAAAVKKIIDEERRRNPAFVHSFEDFYALCRQAINPNLSEEAVERMLIQHLLTERIFERIFDNPDFTRRNVVAAEIEKVIVELTKRAFNRNEFLRPLDRFYRAIEVSAENTSGFSEKQAFLNKVYERFFQGYSPKEADTHGIVYTPQPIVNFMVRSVEEILQKEFGRSLSDKGVHILDPFVGTGNFIVRIMQEIKTTDLPYKYENELHCNEVMLLPYYIASMNIEHKYFERVGEYKAFPGICLVDTFDMRAQSTIFTEANTDRIERQRQETIFVVIGNPPYNAWQVNENDNNKNRKYKALDDRVNETYAKTSQATNKSALSDPYVKAIRWASDRIKDEGVVALVTNSGFVDSLAADGMRANLAREFDDIFILDLGGNVRRNPKLSGTTHNVFGIQVGVSVNLFIRKNVAKELRRCKIHYLRAGEFLTRYQKYIWLDDLADYTRAPWLTVVPDKKNNWLTHGDGTQFDGFWPIGEESEDPGFFSEYTPAPNTARDAWVYNFSLAELKKNVKLTSGTYNDHVARWKALKEKPETPDEFTEYDDQKISWSRDLKKDLQRENPVVIAPNKFRVSLYRPFTKEHMFFDRILVEEVYRLPQFLPNAEASDHNCLICVTSIGSEKPFMAMATNVVPNYHLVGAGCGTQVFPFYTYAEDGTNRRENITDWALEQFRSHYGDRSITKWDIFHYIYAVLHHPEYRQRYAANLRRELPRIPFVSATPDRVETGIPARPAEQRSASASTPTLSSRAERDFSLAKDHAQSRDLLSAAAKPHPSTGKLTGQANSRSFDSVSGLASESTHSAQDDKVGVKNDLELFRAFVKAGQRLAEIHVDYEQQPEYSLTKTEKAGEKLDYRVTKMKLSKDKTSLIYNQFLTRSEIPKETYDYRLGNRSALEWIIDQYQVSTDKRSGIANDPNRADDPTYILRLIGQVITVRLETAKIVATLPPLGLPESSDIASRT